MYPAASHSLPLLRAKRVVAGANERRLYSQATCIRVFIAHIEAVLAMNIYASLNTRIHLIDDGKK